MAIAAARPDTASVSWRRSRGAAQSTRRVSAKALASAKSMAPPPPAWRRNPSRAAGRRGRQEQAREATCCT
eukprot:1836258-Alexandrium_andersonii.AAC.1